MFTKTQMQLMLDMQNNMNTLIDKDWIKNQNPFMLAAALEMGEAIEHYGWKWWKKQTPDMNQVRMEMADIWHFLLSQTILDMHYNPDNFTLDSILSADQYNNLLEDLCLDDFTQLTDLQLMTLLMSSYGIGLVNVPVFLYLCGSLGLSTEDLFKLYVGKNVLNEFRQANGYKEGSYIKVWSGREDNEYLTEIMDTVYLDATNLKEEVYNALKAAYTMYA